jgi:hypothetical protein
VDELIFSDSAGTWQQRWEIIRRFATVWCGVKFAPSATADARLSEAERVIGRSLPGSLRESITFHSELEAAGWAYNLSIKPLPDLRAVLLCSIEDDCYSVVHDADLTLDDPPVHGYYRGYGVATEDQFGHFGIVASTITADTLVGMITPAYPRGGSFYVQVEATPDWLEEMRAAFSLSAAFCDLQVFESPGQLVLVGKDAFHPDNVIVMRGLWMSDYDAVPECVARWLSNGGGFTGRFGPRR